MAIRIEADPSLVSPDFTIEKFKTATRVVQGGGARVRAGEPQPEPEPERQPEPEREHETVGADADEATRPRSRAAGGGGRSAAAPDGKRRILASGPFVARGPGSSFCADVTGCRRDLCAVRANSR
jgi:ribonuclease E